MEQQKSKEFQSRKERKSEVKKLVASLFAFSLAANSMSGYKSVFSEEGEKEDEKRTEC